MNRAALALTLALGLMLLGGVLAAVWMQSATPAASTESPTVDSNEGLNATLWVQTSAEYVAAALQAYELARLRLDVALADAEWTAALEQAAAGGYQGLAPAVILDVDETVLDNSAYQARLILDDDVFSTENWQDWVREARAVPVPGALEFTLYAASRGVDVYYVTNRRHEVEEPTRRNLQATGFPLRDDADVLLTRDEQPDWGSDKGTRRLEVGKTHRILLLLGDNYGDFASETDVSVQQRDTMVQEHAYRWGHSWIMLPNPQYGSWDGALINYEYDLPLAQKQRVKLDALEPAR